MSFNQLKSQRQELDEHCRVLKQGAKWFQHAYRSVLTVVSLLPPKLVLSLQRASGPLPTL